MPKKCIKCGYARDDELDKNTPDYECPRCGVIYEKAKANSTLTPPSPSKHVRKTVPQEQTKKPALQEQTKKPNKNLTKCKDCGESISKKAKNCPHCGAPIALDSNAFGCLGCLTVIILFVVGSFFISFFSADKTPQKSKRPQLTVAQKAEKKAAREKKRAEEYELCKKDLQCWGDKHSFKAIIAGEKLIERHAKYQFEWTDGWGPKLSGFRWKNKARLTLTYFGDKIKFQNGFGAWQNMTYQVDYDPINEKLLGVRVY